MVRPGAIAFPVILALGAITGYLTYTYFAAAMPTEGRIDSPYYKPLSASEGNQSGNASAPPVDESKYTNKVAIKILKGAATQGSPDYDPDAAKASSDALVTWTNDDTTIHTATSGTDSSDPESGKLFDSKYLQPEGKYSVPASQIGKGDHKYYCQIHPYMTGTITIE
jgi:plastocyanin